MAIKKLYHSSRYSKLRTYEKFLIDEIFILAGLDQALVILSRTKV